MILPLTLAGETSLSTVLKTVDVFRVIKPQRYAGCTSICTICPTTRIYIVTEFGTASGYLHNYLTPMVIWRG